MGTALGAAVSTSPALTDAAVVVLLAACEGEPDFAGWLADVLARVAARLGSSAALIEGRPGSWEADLVLRLVWGTVGEDDADLARYGLST